MHLKQILSLVAFLAQHVQFIQELEEQRLVSLTAVFDELIFGWLRSNLANDNISDLSMDLSMDAEEETQVAACDLAVPYFSADVTRMAFLLKYRCDKELASKIKSLKVNARARFIISFYLYSPRVSVSRRKRGRRAEDSRSMCHLSRTRQRALSRDVRRC